MDSPVSVPLVIALFSHSPTRTQNWLQGLQRWPQRPAHGTWVWHCVHTSEQLWTLLKDETRLQAVVIGDDVPIQQTEQALSAWQQYRPELDYYLVLHQAHTFGLATFKYLTDQPSVWGQWYAHLWKGIQTRAATPFYSALRDYVTQAHDAWHTPGHGGGDSVRESAWIKGAYDFFGASLWASDLSVSVPVLDSVVQPRGVLADAQQLAARAFGARETFFVTHGTSSANKIVLSTVLRANDVAIVERHCHQSIHHGLRLCGAQPVYLPLVSRLEQHLLAPAHSAHILAALANYPQAKLLVLTAVTYEGLRHDLRPLIAAAHSFGVRVLVDEAWFAYARFHPRLRPTALECGADYVTQSTHKTLSALSQGSMIHVNDPDFPRERFYAHLRTHTSTSPLYPVLASLDLARQQAVMEGYHLLTGLLRTAELLRERFTALGLPPLSAAQVAATWLDPLRITLDLVNSGYDGATFCQRLFHDFHIQVEKFTRRTVSFLLTLGTPMDKLSRLIHAVACLQRESSSTSMPLAVAQALPTHPPRLLLTPQVAFDQEGEWLPLWEGVDFNPALLGCVSAEQVSIYPPGIPVLLCGEEILAPSLVYLFAHYPLTTGTVIQGVQLRGGIPHLRVLAPPPYDDTMH